LGERSAEVRDCAVAGLGVLGLAIDEQLNTNGNEDREITATRCAGERWWYAREDLEVARHARAVVETA
jgi:acetate kinase